MIDYGSTLWDSSSMNILKPLHSVYKRALKNVLNKGSRLTTADYLLLQILPLKDRFLFNKSMIMNKINSGTAPLTLCNQFTKIETRNSSKFLTPIPRIDLYKSSLLYSGSVLWNSLPLEFKQLTTHKCFKEKIKKHFLNELHL